jgi:hypothetical protein
MNVNFIDSWRDNPTIETPVYEKKNVEFDERGTLADGTTKVGRVDYLWYVLGNDGQAISKGYHQIRVNDEGQLVGKVGANIELVQYP